MYIYNLLFPALVGSLGQCLGYLLGPLGCCIYERFGFRKTSILCSVIVVAGLASTAISPSFPLFYLTYGCMTGIGLSFIHNAAVVVVMNHFQKWRAMSSGVVQSAFAVGILSVSQLTRKVIDTFGWRWAVGAWSILGALTFPCGMVFDDKTTQGCDRECVNHQQSKQWNKLLVVLRNRRLMLLSASFVLSYMCFYVPHMFMVSKLGIYGYFK